MADLPAVLSSQPPCEVCPSINEVSDCDKGPLEEAVGSGRSCLLNTVGWGIGALTPYAAAAATLLYASLATALLLAWLLAPVVRTRLRLLALATLWGKVLAIGAFFLLLHDCDTTTGVCSIWVFFATVLAHMAFLSVLLYTVLSLSAGLSIVRPTLWREQRRKISSRVSLFGLVFFCHFILRRWFSLILVCIYFMVVSDAYANLSTQLKALKAQLLMTRNLGINPLSTPIWFKYTAFRSVLVTHGIPPAALAATTILGVFFGTPWYFLVADEVSHFAIIAIILDNARRTYLQLPFLTEAFERDAPQLTSLIVSRADLVPPRMRLQSWTPQVPLPVCPRAYLRQQMGYVHVRLVTMQQFDAPRRDAEAGVPWAAAHPHFLKQVLGGPPEGAPPYPVVLVAPDNGLFLALPADVADHWKVYSEQEEEEEEGVRDRAGNREGRRGGGGVSANNGGGTDQEAGAVVLYDAGGVGTSEGQRDEGPPV